MKAPEQFTLPETGYIRLDLVLRYIPVSRSQWWAMMRDGRAPAAYKITANITAWKAEDIRALILEIAQRGQVCLKNPTPER